MSTDPMCLALGGVISFIVSLFKKIPLVKKHPKVVAFLLSVLGGTLMAQTGSSPAEWKIIVKCVLEQFAASVATHETVVHTLQNQTGERSSEDPS